jgi:hypothetical protein
MGLLLTCQEISGKINTKYNYKIVHSARSFSPINLQKIVPYLIDMQQFFLSSWQKIKSHLWTIL